MQFPLSQVYNSHVRIAKVNDRIEVAKKLILAIADDAQKILTMAQMALPVGEVVARRVVDRVNEMRSIFGEPSKEEGNKNGPSA